MSEKQKLIKELIQMQKKFMRIEKSNGIDFENYYAANCGNELSEYQDKYNALANRLVDLAHIEKGSNR
ncbi:MAG: hypothetical protein OXE41_04790 [Gammaproteobacteria bacterium]|nr:hypothetical protein [Gammaproteobacteria bacterium]MCY4219576.1 hypothetical protein [Gammaproteobacteria bacterium]MCY4274699.1 hypothetical protein [Gammaproteobacteria bacterium]